MTSANDNSSGTLQGVTSQPVQARSRETQARLLDALERLLATRSINDLTVAEIAREAGVTTGAIYRRFKDKQALLQAAFERFHNEASTARAIDASSLESDDAVILETFRGVLHYALDHMALMRAAAAFDDDFAYASMREAREEVAASLARNLKQPAFNGDELERRCRFALRMATAVVRDTFMSGPGAFDGALTRAQFEHRQRNSIDRLLADLTEMAAAYLLDRRTGA